MYPALEESMQRDVLLRKISECAKKPAGDEIKRLKNLRDFQEELESTGIKIPGFTTTKLQTKKFRADSPACERYGGWDNIKSTKYTGYKITSGILTEDCFISVEFKNFDDGVTMAVYVVNIHKSSFFDNLKDATFPLIFRLLEMFTEIEHDYSHAADEKYRIEKERLFRKNSCDEWIKSICEGLTVPYQILPQYEYTLLCLVLNERNHLSISIPHENFEKVMPELLSTIQAFQNIPQKFKLELSIKNPVDGAEEDWDPRDDPDGAEEQFFRAHSPPPSVEKIVKAAEKEKDDGPAISIYTKAINTIPGASGEWKLFFNRGIRYFNKLQYDKSKKDFLEYLRLKPDAKGYYNLGLVCVYLEEYAEARENFLQALKLKPEYKIAMDALAALDKETGYHEGEKAEKAAAPPVPPPAFCSQCGVKLTSDAKFCLSCGAKVSAADN
jgi:tetratricopeptide (TPR) repeat protein